MEASPRARLREAGHPNKMQKLTDNEHSGTEQEDQEAALLLISNDCLGEIFSRLASFKQLMSLRRASRYWNERIPTMAAKIFSKKWLPRTVAPLDQMIIKLKAMDKICTLLGRDVEIFQLPRAGRPEPFPPALGGRFDLPHEQMLTVFPNNMYTIRVSCRKAIEIHSYCAENTTHTTLIYRTETAFPVNNITISDDCTRIAVAYTFQEELDPEVEQQEEEFEEEKIQTKIDIFSFDPADPEPLKLLSEAYTVKSLDKFTDHTDSVLAFAAGDSSAYFVVSGGVAEVRTSDTGRICGFLDLELDSAEDCRFCYNRKEGRVILYEAGRVKSLSLSLDPSNERGRAVKRLFKTSTRSSEDPQFYASKWLVCDGRVGTDVFDLATGQRVLECAQWDIVPFPHLNKYIVCEGDALVIVTSMGPNKPQKRRRIEMNYSDRELVGDDILLTLAYQDEQQQQQSIKKRKNQVLFAVDLNRGAITQINLTSLLPELFPALGHEEAEEQKSLFYDLRGDPNIVTLSAADEQDVILRFFPPQICRNL